MFDRDYTDKTIDIVNSNARRSRINREFETPYNNRKRSVTLKNSPKKVNKKFHKAKKVVLSSLIILALARHGANQYIDYRVEKGIDQLNTTPPITYINKQVDKSMKEFKIHSPYHKETAEIILNFVATDAYNDNKDLSTGQINLKTRDAINSAKNIILENDFNSGGNSDLIMVYESEKMPAELMRSGLIDKNDAEELLKLIKENKAK